jgi:DNA-binding MarR family transcriptional regulator
VAPADPTSPSSTPLSDTEENVVRALTRALQTIPRALEADLLREHGMPLNEYFTLMHLSEAPAQALRMSDLAANNALSLSGVTRIVQRLERQGYVVRERASCDGRGWNARLTDAGLDRLREVWPAHLESVRRQILDPIAEFDPCTVAAALGRMAPGTECSEPHDTGFC